VGVEQQLRPGPFFHLRRFDFSYSSCYKTVKKLSAFIWRRWRLLDGLELLFDFTVGVMMKRKKEVEVTLKLLVETIVGIGLGAAWWYLFAFKWWDAIESRVRKRMRVKKVVMEAYHFGAPITLALLSLPLRNWWFTVLVLLSPLWAPYGFEGLEFVANRTNGRRLLGDWVLLYPFLAVVFLVVGFILWPISWGDSLHVYTNLTGVIFGLAFGTLTGASTTIGGLIGWWRWRNRQLLGGVLGGVIGWLLPMVLLTVQFDSMMTSMVAPFHYASPVRLYVAGFLTAFVVLVIAVWVVVILIAEEPVDLDIYY